MYSLIIKFIAVLFLSYISKADLNHYVPGSGEQAHISMPGENGTEIDFNDSVSQVTNYLY